MVSGAPKYVAISSALRARIDAGEFGPGDRLPAQHALADEYDVTVMTLRQALAELERDGLVRAVPGSGTFVSEQPAVRLGLDHLWSFVQEMEYQGNEIDTEVLAVRHDIADASTVRGALDLDDRAPLVEVVRRRSIDGVRIVVQRSTLARDLWTKIDDCDLTATSLYDALRDRAGRRVERASETFRAVAASDADAELIDVVAGTPCLESVRVSYASSGPFLHDRAVLLGSAAEVCAERAADGLRLGYRAT